MTDYRQHRNEIKRLFNAPKHRRLKYLALIVIGAVIAAQIAMIIWANAMTDCTRLIIRGCCGIGALVFVILATIITYRVYSEYFGTRYDRTKVK
jgi:hypothetical protein